jgi:hypothetical protein
MCLLCSYTPDNRSLARRSHVLRLLALVEHPDALPADAALRLACDVLRLTQTDGAIRQCEEVTPPADIASNAERPS